MATSQDRWQRPRRIAVVLGLAAVCAGAPAALASHRTIARGDAKTVATAINLRHSDLPTLTEKPNPTTAADRRHSARLTKCVGGVVESNAFANVQSSQFTNSGQPTLEASSSTEILPTASLVAQDLTAAQRPRALTCILGEARDALRGSIPKADTMTATIARLPSVVGGSDGAFAFRLIFVVHAKQGGTTVNVPIYEDGFGFAYGQAEVSLTVETTFTKPSASLERALAARLLARAHAAIG